MASDVDVERDKRLSFIRDFTIKSLRVKPDKWNKLCNSDEQKYYLAEFVAGGIKQELIISQNVGGQLQIHNEWPSKIRSKGVYFVKREREELPKCEEETTSLNDFMVCGDVSPNVLEHFCLWVDEVIAPVFKHQKNIQKFPHCIGKDIKKQVHELCTTVYQIKGYMKGKTLLPFPERIDEIEDEERKVRESEGKMFDMILKTNIEGIIIKWGHQVDEILGMDCEHALQRGESPGPMAEVEFWEAKYVHLESLHEQMIDKTAKNMASILKYTDSAYFPCFRSMYRNVCSALKESLDITSHLKPLVPHFKAIEKSDFADLRSLFSPLMHTVCLVYSNSEHYNSPARVIVLIQEICNLLISLVKKQIDPPSLFKIEIEEALDKVGLSLSTMKDFRNTFRKYKEKLPSYFSDEIKPKRWTFQEELVFKKIDTYIERLKIIFDFCNTSNQFLKLEKVEVGGIRGKLLTENVRKVYIQFKSLYATFGLKTYDSLDPSGNGFPKDFDKFNNQVWKMDRKLAAALSRAFDDCTTSGAIFKLFDIFGNLLQRSLIANQVSEKMPLLVNILDKELDKAKEVFEEHKSQVKHNKKLSFEKNAPLHSGQLKFSAQLRSKISLSIKSFKNINHPICYSTKGDQVLTKFKTLHQELNQFEDDVYTKWLKTAEKYTKIGLEKPLIVRENSDETLKVNFSDKTMGVLMEVQNFKKFFPSRPIPEKVEETYKRFTDIKKLINMLDMIVDLYNYLKLNTALVDKNLIKDEMAKIDKNLNKAETTMNWNSDKIKEYIEEILSEVSAINQRVRDTQDNIIEVYKEISKFEKEPLFLRIKLREKEYSVLNITERAEIKKARYKDLEVSSAKIKKLIQTNQEIFKINLRSNTSVKAWYAYLQYVDCIVFDSVLQMVATSLAYLLDETDPKNNPEPLFDLKLSLFEPDIIYQPSIDKNIVGNFFDLTSGLVDDILEMAKVFQRVAYKKEFPTYLEEVAANAEIKRMKKTFLDRVDRAVKSAKEYSDKYIDYNFLWTNNRKEFLEYFLKTAKQMSSPMKSKNTKETKTSTLSSKKTPSLEQFKEQIDFFEDLHKEVKEIEATKVFNYWFRLDVNPLRLTILTNIKKWSFLFKKYLLDEVSERLLDLNDFIEHADEGMMVQLVPGDYKALIKVMGILKSIRDRQVKTDEMFNPLEEKIELLRQYGMIIPENVIVFLEDLPEKWANTKRLSVTARQEVLPLEGVEKAKLKVKVEAYERVQREFRIKFLSKKFFKFKCENPYDLLYEGNKQIREVEEEGKSIESEAILFDVPAFDFSLIQQCRKEIQMLKQLCDFSSLVTTSFEEWKSTLWINIDVENMDSESKKFVKYVRSLDKEMKDWDLYKGLELTIKNMLTCLRAMGELQNSAIRDRHWEQLVQETKVKFVMTDDTCLSDLLELNLHEYEDEVVNLVDKACKELQMEKMIKSLSNTWQDMEFTKDTHARTECKLLKGSEDLIETLEENQVQLQGMMNSKYIAHFYEEISSWQKTLCTVDAVTSLLFEVQRTWSHLESIFVGSEDIRLQLPVDSERFDETNDEFQKLMKKMTKTTNVIKTTGKEGLIPKLEEVHRKLGLCEKALAEYLETKQIAFPRFYFVSSADLLDILSNGHQPLVVAKHFTKLFDSLAKIDMELDDEGAPTNKAVRMTAKDGESVDFAEPCNCDGKVENWLNNLMTAMQEGLRKKFSESFFTYEQTPREKWLFFYPAQVSLGGTQIWWTTEVNQAFEKMEEGYEYALKEYHKRQIFQLNNLIALLIGDLTKGERQMIMTICTIDVHSRDVVSKMIASKEESISAFSWQSQLKHRWNESDEHCYANICDAQFQYGYEYLGNTPRLVITPLTDRCYITLTQSLHLIMGGAPQGPAGTGKTETTKDLGKAIGIMVYVFNCSEQMDYKSCGNIFKGLSQTGAWGCFDEFNRITVEVLSVIAVQVKSIQDAMKAGKLIFDFMGQIIKNVPTIGYFITMNPGYAGRAELPENLKVLFRPCAMCVPDFRLISEIMLVAQGFLEARPLSNKFITLYKLCKELLSKQDHYDWGLRAIKSVLVVAGSLKRADHDRPEEEVLMRALRDFNIPKIVADDFSKFQGLISDLFPNLEVPRSRDQNFEKAIKASACDLQLQPQDNFILKVVQLDELFDVRHSVFIVGDAGTGKSQTWKTLFKTYQNMKKKPVYADLNPKAVTNDELYGIINPATREWQDGLFSNIMRDMANLTTEGPKWIVLDGDIDPMWIESLNTVMDDNKILTLASNERIPMTPDMRLLFEVGNLKTATPATVSRAGILYISPGDLGWMPYATSWIEKRERHVEKVHLRSLVDKYIPVLHDEVSKQFKQITPISKICHMQMLCSLMDSILSVSKISADAQFEQYEMLFVFVLIWSYGSSLYDDGQTNSRNEFTKFFMRVFPDITFPKKNISLFEWWVDPTTYKFTSWSEKVPTFELDSEVPLQACLVHNSDTIRIKFFLDLLIESKFPTMLIGIAGCGKTLLMNEKLNSLSEDYHIANVPFNFYYTAAMTQKILEKPLEKKAGRNYGPQGSKKLIYFLDDFNMPEVDQYSTVGPHTIIRQHIDYSHWYCRTKLSLKDIHNTQYVACMNPTAGAFTINPRLQRHFATFSVVFPVEESLFAIYNSILTGHIGDPLNKFLGSIQKMCPNFVNATIELHKFCAQTFTPTAEKFHYFFNLRDLSQVFSGTLFSSVDCVKVPEDFARLWLHETQRVYKDKLCDAKDIDNFEKNTREIVKKYFEDCNEKVINKEPLIYCHFSRGIGEPKYMPVEEWESLSKILRDALRGYNELNAAMDLVLFEDAMKHICRINRILETPRANALLVGVGGSGKQSLSRLAAFISSMEVFQISVTNEYSVTDFMKDLSVLYIKAGIKNISSVFLMSDAQVSDEKFLVLVNNLLASGEIPDLFTDDEVDNIVIQIRNEVKNAGISDSRENCWKFFIDKVRKYLKVVLCFSPVGGVLRKRGRKFPSITNCTCINWFHEWPKDALVSVSIRFLSENKKVPEEFLEPIGEFMANVHNTTNEVSKLYKQNEKKFNYTTPKSFLELINLYSQLLTTKHDELEGKINRLGNGLKKLKETGLVVEELKAQLAVQKIELEKKNQAADHLIEVVGVETKNVSNEKIAADEEKIKVDQINIEVTAKQIDCEKDLKKAEPALAAAQEALNTLNKANLTELKSFGSPPAAVMLVTEAVMVLLVGNDGKIPKDRSWARVKVMMGKVDSFLDQLVNYEKENIHQNVLIALQPYLEDAQFDPDFIRSKSAAAAGLCSWVINVVQFYNVYCDVRPKRQALQEANDQLLEAQTRLAAIITKVADLEERLKSLTAQYESAVEEKVKCQEAADSTAATISLANRLVNGLSSENIRWKNTVEEYKKQASNLPGDVLLVSSFISYAGCFTKQYRMNLLDEKWLPFHFHSAKKIPMSLGFIGSNILSLLVDDADIAVWNNEGLPSDAMSIENATILTNSIKWPLLIDPQLQGVKWIKSRYGGNINIIRLNQKNYLDIVADCVSKGRALLIENLSEEIDPVLEPLLGRMLIKKGTAIKLGDKEINYDPSFKLFLHTKMANPHYKPELQAQTTLINFTVTRTGLEDQILAEIVKADRPDLEQQKSELTKQLNEYKILLKSLEDNLLMRLNTAGDDIIHDVDLVENLEETKKTAAEVEAKVADARQTSQDIDQAREEYRSAAARASVLYFILNDLHRINPMYQFSLKAFSVVYEKAIKKAIKSNIIMERVKNLIDSITFSVFQYTTRGLFECDKQIFTVQMAFQILLMNGNINATELDFLLRFPGVPNSISPVAFISNVGWGAIRVLSGLSNFKNLDRDIENNAKKWEAFVEGSTPEKDKFPQEWKKKNSFQKLCMLRTVRPDRMIYAINKFIEENLGVKYVENRQVPFSESYEESGSSTPIFFVLSPGVDPLKDVEALGNNLGFSVTNENFHNISLGQGQEVVAEQAMETAAKEGHWIVLQNIHLVKMWLPKLEKIIEEFSEGANDNYRLFLSADPAPNPAAHIIPQAILESSIKITNEPPSGVQANLHKALDNFSQDTLEMCTREAEYKSILFSLCYFHAVVAERRKFGPQGWNKSYPFNTGDLVISSNVLYNYLEEKSQVPWEDLRYLFGEIMYGGHITDDWDKRLCKVYLEELMGPDQLEGELMLAPEFPSPPNMDFKGYRAYIDKKLPPESPHLYGLHSNAEIGFLTTISEHLFKIVFELQPRESGNNDGPISTREEKVKTIVDEIMEKMPDSFNVTDLLQRCEDKTPYILVCFQECERMNQLTDEIKRSLRELDLGLKGELTMTHDMEELSRSLFFDQVPFTWSKLAYASLNGLSAWYADLLLRISELQSWTADFMLPVSVWLSGFFNPQSFLTAIMQTTARKNELPLDKMTLMCEVTQMMTKEEITNAPTEGANVYGMFLEGARWNLTLNCLTDSRLKELHPSLPIMLVKAVTQDVADKQDMRFLYTCPVYKTRQRGPTYVWAFNIRTKEKPSKWVLAGVALLLQI